MADRWLAAFMFVLAGVYIAATTRLPSLEIGDPLGPRAFPYLIGAAGILAGIWLLVEHAARTKLGTQVASTTADVHKPVAVAAVLGWMLLFYFMFERLGFLLGMGLFVFGLTSYFYRNHWITNLIVSVAFPVGIYIAFTKILAISLPRGLLQF
jgi:putative tricarboxylic transport membrane protein